MTPVPAGRQRGPVARHGHTAIRTVVARIREESQSWT